MTNEVIQNIITRRSIKQYKDQQITDEELQTVLHAGLYAPVRHGNAESGHGSGAGTRILWLRSFV